MGELWFIAIATLCIAAVVNATLRLFHRKCNNNLPPGPPSFPLIGNLVWFRRSVSEMEVILRGLQSRYGGLITMKMGPRRLIFIGDRSLAHRALVQNGAVFSDRPGRTPISSILKRSEVRISSSSYGPTWRLLRRNLSQEILHPSRVKAYSHSRSWVLSLLINRLNAAAPPVRLIDHFQFAMFSLLVFMCFGDRLSDSQIKQVESVQRNLILSFNSFDRLTIWPRVSRFLFPKTWNRIVQVLDDQKRVLIPLIRARVHATQNHETPAYVDTLVGLKLPEEQNRNLAESDMLSLCSEFLNAGTDTTSTALQWTMANLVKYPQIQEKVYQEIVGVVGPSPPLGNQELQRAVEEDDLDKLPYLKAVVLEALRRHPPGHFVLPHKVREDVELEGYKIPKNAVINFMVADMGWDPEVWEDPMEFKPDRFMSKNGEAPFDITGSREIKMMPFGTGRRICPGLGLALMHLEYFVANLIWYFKWSPVDGDEVDLTEKQEFTTVMKFPLQARISPRN